MAAAPSAVAADAPVGRGKKVVFDVRHGGRTLHDCLSCSKEKGRHMHLVHQRILAYKLHEAPYPYLPEWNPS